jgi:hypothetical protein
VASLDSARDAAKTIGYPVALKVVSTRFRTGRMSVSSKSGP